MHKMCIENGNRHKVNREMKQSQKYNKQMSRTEMNYEMSVSYFALCKKKFMRFSGIDFAVPCVRSFFPLSLLNHLPEIISIIYGL